LPFQSAALDTSEKLKHVIQTASGSTKVASRLSRGYEIEHGLGAIFQYAEAAPSGFEGIVAQTLPAHP
jgi:hypothetical protein